MIRTKQQAFEVVASSLREFGYPDVSASMIADVYTAMADKRELPHGIIGSFVQDQLHEVWGLLDRLP